MPIETVAGPNDSTMPATAMIDERETAAVAVTRTPIVIAAPTIASPMAATPAKSTFTSP